MDTFFKKYTITYTDEDNNKKVMTFKFLRDYFDEKSSNSQADKVYLVESHQGENFMLSDYLDLPLLNQLVIYSEKPLPDGGVNLFRIKNTKSN